MSSRGSFSGQLGFILAATGSAIGLSNIWRFPYLAGQHGGAVFLIIYLLCIFLFCFPVMVGEVSMGRAAGLNAYGAYTKLGNRKWGILGLAGVVSGVLILSYYNVVAAWAFGYFVEITFGGLLEHENYRAFFGDFVNNVEANLLYSFLFLGATGISVAGGVQKGIERANSILMPGLLLILVGLIAYSLTLPSAEAGIRFYLVPDFQEVTAQTIFESLKLSFFTLSLGVGGLMTYGSYLKKDENIIRSASVVTWADTVIAFLAGLMIFPLVFSAGKSPAEGPALVFVVMPEIFKAMPQGTGQFVGALFFLLLCSAALPSCISLIELPVAYFVDELKFKRKKVVLTLFVIIYVLGIPSVLSFGAVPSLTHLGFYQGRDFLTFIADMTDISLTLGGCLMCVFIGRRWKIKNMHEELASGNSGYSRSFVRKYLDVTILYVCPVLLGIMTILIIIDKIFGLF